MSTARSANRSASTNSSMITDGFHEVKVQVGACRLCRRLAGAHPDGRTGGVHGHVPAPDHNDLARPLHRGIVLRETPGQLRTFCPRRYQPGGPSEKGSKRSRGTLHMGQVSGGLGLAQRYPQTLHRQIPISPSPAAGFRPVSTGSLSALGGRLSGIWLTCASPSRTRLET